MLEDEDDFDLRLAVLIAEHKPKVLHDPTFFYLREMALKTHVE